MNNLSGPRTDSFAIYVLLDFKFDLDSVTFYI